MATIDNATGESVPEPEAKADNVLRMPDGEARAERVKTQRKERRRTTKPLASLDAATEFVQDFPNAMGASVEQAAQGVQQVARAGLDIGKLLLIGAGIFLFLELTADKRLKRYTED